MPQWITGPITDAAAKSTPGNDRDGVFAELVVLEEGGLVRIPDHLSFEEAATLPLAGVTAWNALTTAGTGAGTTVLLQGTGGVSIFALQFARGLGARILITSSHDEKLSRALALGADAGTNYKTHPDWDRWTRQQTSGTGADVVVEVGVRRYARQVVEGGQDRRACRSDRCPGGNGHLQSDAGLDESRGPAGRVRRLAACSRR